MTGTSDRASLPAIASNRRDLAPASNAGSTSLATVFRGIARQDVVFAALYFALFWLLAAVNLSSAFSKDLPWLAPLCAAVACLGILFRRSSPLLMAAIVVPMAFALSLQSQAFWMITIFEVFFSLVLFGSEKTSRFAARSSAILAAVAVVAVLLLTRSAQASVLAAIFAAVTVLTPVEWAGSLRRAQQLAGVESARAAAVKEASEQRLLAEQIAHDLKLEQQRQYLARELHDVVSARLSAIALQSGAAIQAAALRGSAAQGTVDTEQATLRDTLASIRSESVAGLDELRQMIRLLHVGELTETPGSLDQLESLVNGFRNAGLIVDLHNELPRAGTQLSPELQTAVFRIVSEALTNVTKHSPGAPATVALAFSDTEPRRLELLISNPLNTPGDAITQQIANDPSGPGTGTGTRTSTGTGIPSIGFRTSYLGGTVTAGADSGEWLVKAAFPAPEAQPVSQFPAAPHTEIEAG